MNAERPQTPTGVEQVMDALAELEGVFGESGRGVVRAVRSRLGEALAARDRGNPAAMLEAIAAAMAELPRLADRLAGDEAMLMRLVAGRFRQALLRGNVPEARQDLDLMFERSGARYRKP